MGFGVGGFAPGGAASIRPTDAGPAMSGPVMNLPGGSSPISNYPQTDQSGARPLTPEQLAAQNQHNVNLDNAGSVLQGTPYQNLLNRNGATSMNPPVMHGDYYAPAMDQNAWSNSRFQGQYNDLNNYLGQANNRGAPQMNAAQIGDVRNAGIPQLGPAYLTGGPDFAAQEQTRQQQQALSSMLMGQASGNAPSLAQMQLNQGMQQQVAGQAALAQSAPGGANAALAQRTALNNAANAQQQTSIQGAMLRLQEQQQAQQALGGLLGQQRGADLTATQLGTQNNQFNASNQNNFALNQAGLTAQGNQFNANAGNNFTLQQALLNQQAGTNNLNSTLNNQSQRDALLTNLLSQRTNLSEADLQRAMDYQKSQAHNDLTAQGLQAGISVAQQQAQAQIIGSALGAAGAGVGAYFGAK